MLDPRGTSQQLAILTLDRTHTHTLSLSHTHTHTHTLTNTHTHTIPLKRTRSRPACRTWSSSQLMAPPPNVLWSCKAVAVAADAAELNFTVMMLPPNSGVLVKDATA